MCLIDLRKAYNAVGREQLLWQVLTRVGIPSKTLSIIRQCHDVMRACVRTDDVEHSKLFDFTQGLRQDSVMSPSLFKFFPRCCVDTPCSRRLHRRRRHSKGLGASRGGCGGQERDDIDMHAEGSVGHAARQMPQTLYQRQRRGLLNK